MKKLLLATVALFTGIGALAATGGESFRAAAGETVTIRTYIFTPEYEPARLMVFPAGDRAYGPATDLTVEVEKGTEVRIEVLFNEDAPEGCFVEFWYKNGSPGSFVGQNSIRFKAERSIEYCPSIVVK